MGVTFMIAAGLIGYAIPSILHNMGIHVTTKIPVVNYTSRTWVTFIPAEPSSWIVTSPGHVVTVGFPGCSYGTLTITGPGMYVVESSSNTASINVSRPGVYYISYVCNSTLGAGYNVIKVGFALIYASNPISNWLVDALINAILSIASLFYNCFVSVLTWICQFFGIDYLYLTPTFEMIDVYRRILTVCIPISLIVLAIDAAIIAFESRDPLDFLLQFCYDFGMWSLGTFYGYAIFNIAAGFLNYIVLTCLDFDRLIGFTAYIIGGSIALLVGLILIGVLTPTESFPAMRLIVVLPLLSLVLIGYARIVLVEALVSILPLIMAMWVLPYTRKIADMLLMTLAWAVLGGVVNAAIMDALAHFVGYSLTHGGLVLMMIFIPILQLILFISLIGIRKETGAIIKRKL
ncbi:MAG: hypothetical protein GXO43_08540 [Crenarchaeota archaeon]|nr:hypothetical protein [Thermoproteota archaeon]